MPEYQPPPLTLTYNHSPPRPPPPPRAPPPATSSYVALSPPTPTRAGAPLPAAGRTTPPDPVDAERLAQFRRTARQLQQDGWISITAAAGPTPGPDAILRLEPLEPDPRFEVDPAFRDLLPPPSPGELA